MGVVMRTFVEWFERETGRSASELQLEAAFDVAVCRVESAAAQRAVDPIACLGNRSSRFSRGATKSMLGNLGYTPAQTRVMQRLLAGSSGGWPGLLRLYIDGTALDRSTRAYIARQIRIFRSVRPEHAAAARDSTRGGVSADRSAPDGMAGGRYSDHDGFQGRKCHPCRADRRRGLVSVRLCSARSADGLVNF